MYFQTDDSQLKKNIIISLSQIKSDRIIDTLIEIAGKEEDPELRKTIVVWLSQSKDEKALRFLKEIIEK